MTKKLTSIPAKQILWVDLEMTGLDPVNDRILEVAAIATDWQFVELGTYTAVVTVDPQLLEERMDNGRAFWDKFPQVRADLTKQNTEHGRPAATIEDELLAFIDEHFDATMPVLLAGNSIHQDRKFIDNEWPRVAQRLNYRMLDVSAWKVVFEAVHNTHFNKPESHRALEDIRGSIEELKFYLTKVTK